MSTLITRASLLSGALLLAAFANSAQATSFGFDITVGNVSLSSFTGPFVHIDVDLINNQTATITATSLYSTANNATYLMGDGGSLGLNISGGGGTFSFTSALIYNSFTGFTPGTGGIGGPGGTPGVLTDGGANGSLGSAGSFNQTFNSFDGYTHAGDKIVIGLATTGTWSSAQNVLMANGSGFLAASHIFPALGTIPDPSNNFFNNTGYAGGGGSSSSSSSSSTSTGGEQIPEPGSMALLGLGLIASIFSLRRRSLQAC